jgi:enamine deaminase RidA (YjgF/YER057c/UK114 family)
VDNTAREVTAPVTQQVETVKQQVDAIVEEVGGTVVGLGGATQKSADGLLK